MCRLVRQYASAENGAVGMRAAPGAADGGHISNVARAPVLVAGSAMEKPTVGCS